MNQQSIERSKYLSKLAKDFTHFKMNYKNYMITSNQSKNIKSKILNYFNAKEGDWSNWHWQLKNRLHSSEQLKQLFNLSTETCTEIDAVAKKYRWSVTPYYLSQIREFNTNDPIYLQSIPQTAEMSTYGLKDPMNELNSNPAGSITRRYPDRVIINITNCCPTFCRHCQRRRNIGEQDTCISSESLHESIEFIRNNPEIRDVLITGGDPLTLPDNYIENVLKSLREIPSVEIIRIGTRTPVTLPQRITQELASMLKKYAPVYLNTQFNHPLEITPEAREACKILADNGIVLGNQMVFLKNINNDYYMVQLLNQLLLLNRVRPYYIFHPKKVIGTQHFSISLQEGIKIFEHLRGNTSGLAIPTYIVNADKGLGKIPLTGNSLLNKNENNQLVLTTWEGKDMIVDF